VLHLHLFPGGISFGILLITALTILGILALQLAKGELSFCFRFE